MVLLPRVDTGRNIRCYRKTSQVVAIMRRPPQAIARCNFAPTTHSNT